MEDIINFFKDFHLDMDMDFLIKKNLKNQSPIIIKFSNSIPNTTFLSYHNSSDLFISSIIKESNRFIMSTIIKSILETKKNTCSNLKEINLSDKSRYIIRNILDNDSKYMITNGRICAEYLRDSVFWTNVTKNDFIRQFWTNSERTSKVGMISQKEIWIDPTIDWKDNYILSFDKIYIDISTFNLRMLENINNQHIETTLELRFIVQNPMIHFIFEDGYMQNWDKYRDDKIDYILNDKEIGSNSQFRIYRDDQLES